MDIRAIAFDLDDTLLHSDGSISDYTVDVLQQAHARGIRILPASGRTRDSMWRAIPRLCGLLHFVQRRRGLDAGQDTDDAGTPPR